ncbi:MAG: hypothetical protein ACE5FT_03410 [Candidatus Nanoarchaeia archaeon]
MDKVKQVKIGNAQGYLIRKEQFDNWLKKDHPILKDKDIISIQFNQKTIEIQFDDPIDIVDGAYVRPHMRYGESSTVQHLTILRNDFLEQYNFNPLINNISILTKKEEKEEFITGEFWDGPYFQNKNDYYFLIRGIKEETLNIQEVRQFEDIKISTEDFVLKTLHKLKLKYPDGIPIDEVLNEWDKNNIDSNKIRLALTKLFKQGDTFEPRRGFISVI